MWVCVWGGEEKKGQGYPMRLGGGLNAPSIQKRLRLVCGVDGLLQPASLLPLSLPSSLSCPGHSRGSK